MGRHIRKAVAIAAVGGLLLAACGDDDDDDVSTDDPAEDEAMDDESSADTLDITAMDYAFEGVPDSVGAGAELTLHNSSTGEVHEVVAIRLPDGEDRSVEDLMALSEAELNEVIPEDQLPETVIVAPPGEDGMAVLGDGSLSEPGRYALICFIPTGADPEEYLDPANQNEDGPPDVEGGPPHFTQGMFAELTVE